jgi:hypothetical protein
MAICDLVRFAMYASMPTAALLTKNHAIVVV